MNIRVIQYAPSQTTGRQPCTIVRRDFVLSPGDLEMELTLDKQVTVFVRTHSFMFAPTIRASELIIDR